MRLRSSAEYAQAVLESLPTSADDAPAYRLVARQAAERLGLTEDDLRTVRPNGTLAGGLGRFANQHRSNVSATLFRLKAKGEVRSFGNGRNTRYWRVARTRYAGAVLDPTHDEIARRAFEIFAGRGYAHGSHEQDWLQAERELRGE